MGLIDSIKRLFQRDESSMPLAVPEGVCPNCWGEQDYDGKYRDRMKKDNVDLNNAQARLGWIQALAMERVEGVMLKKTDDYSTCPTCKLTFHPDQNKR